MLHAIRPDVLVKGGSYTIKEVVGHEVVEAYGGDIVVTGLVEGTSTTNIVHAIQRQEQRRAA
jgi:D-beta-D-heptose 7-phosphate kinase/D-beta-D-heptose 1-phosphate adenosyltransferase